MSEDGWVSIGPGEHEDDGWQSIGAGKESTPAWKSALRGAAQGASLGFADEITGGLESAAGSLGLVPDKTYEQARDESRAAYHQAEQDNPNTYLTGQVGGSLATLAVPGLNVAKGASLVPRLATLGGVGAVQGYGLSEGDTAEERLTDAAKGTGAGVLAGLGGQAISKVGSAAGYIGQKASDLIGSDRAAKLGKMAANAAIDNTVGRIPGGRYVANELMDKYLPKAAEKIEGQEPISTIHLVDKYGIKTGEKAIYPAIEKIVESSPESLGKYGPVLRNAAERGGASLGATHWVLQNSDPEYRQMLKSISEGTNP